ncbi:hypothetical protein DPMN_177991 [Dreissena polymorpha]|uniref:Uncharacterized protein n=1 Tax=Dreissena polymorpha TaxID=45954 RepID=A0A9D4EA13_DREPO|nr:hypothetical protein DPMN_177991 [Dreissena polymorpha]
MWTGGRRTKTNPKTSPEQSAIFQLVQEINKTNAKHVTSIVSDHKFHNDWAKNVTSRVHVIQLTGTIFELNSHIQETNVLTKFHVFRCFHYIHIEKNAPPTGGHVFTPIWTIFELVRDINKTNVLTNFHDDWAKIVTSRVFTRKTATPPLAAMFLYRSGPFFHDDWAKNETSRQPCYSTERNHFRTQLSYQRKNVLTKFHENWAKNVTSKVFTCFHYKHIEKNAPPTDGHVFSPIWTIFELVRDINKTNVLTNFHDVWAKIVTSRVFTRKTAPPTGGHVFQWTGTTFELNQHII